MRWDIYESPFGALTLVSGESGLREVRFPGRSEALDPEDCDPDSLRDVREQMGL